MRKEGTAVPGQGGGCGWDGPALCERDPRAPRARQGLPRGSPGPVLPRCSKPQNKGDVAAVDSQDKIIVVGHFFFCVSLRHDFFPSKFVLLPSTPRVERESVLKAAAEIAETFPS